MKTLNLWFLLGLILNLVSCNLTQISSINSNNPNNFRAEDLVINNNSLVKQQVWQAKSPANINFRIIDAYADISGRNYVMDARLTSVITLVSDKIYQLELVLKRNSKSSLRSDETIITHFYYDGLELIFFGDKNKNLRFDKNESGKRYLVLHTFEIVQKDNKTYLNPSNLIIDLKREHISSWQRLNSLTLQILFTNLRID